MGKKYERFVVTEKEGGGLRDAGLIQIIVDTETGVNYMFVKSGYGAGLTPLLDSDGKPIVTKG